MQSRSFPVKLAVSAALLIWLIAALLDSVLLDRGSFVDALVLSVPPAEWLLRAIILVLLLVVAIVVAGRTSGLSDEDSVVAEEGPGIDYAGIALSAEVIMISLDREGRITLFNRRCEAITGYRSEEMLGLNFFDELLPPRALPSMLPAFEAILAGGESVRRELPWVTGRGQEVIIGAWTSAVRDDEGGITGVVMVGEEVTEYRLSDAELLLSREPWRPLAETMFGDGLAAVDADGVLTWVSSTLAEMLGRERSDLSGSQLAEIAAVEDRETVTMKLAECLRAGAPERAEFTAAPAQAPPFPAALALSPVAPEDGASSVALAVIRDMSDIKAAEADFLTARAEAQEQLRRLEDELSERDRDTSRAVDAIRAEHAEEIERMRLQMEAAHERVEQVRRSEREQADAGLTELRARLEAAEAAAAKARDAADAETAEAERLRRELEASAAEVDGLRGHELVKQQERIAQLTEELEAAEERVRQAREAALAEQQQRVDALSAELEAERERARVIEDDAAHLAEAAREAALAEQQIARLTAQLDEAAAQVERAREQARAQLAGMLAGMSAKIADIEQAAHHEHEEALAERQEQIETLEARLRDAEERAAQARLLAREEYEGEIATSLAEAAAVEERMAQAKAEAQEQYQAEIDRLAQELDAAINGAGEDGVRLAESLGFLQSLLDGIPYPVFFTDRDGRYQSCNTAFARRIVGMPRQDLLGLSFDDLRGRIPGELMEALRRGERDVLTEGVEEAYEVRVPISGGQQRTFAFRKEPCLDHEGQIVGVIGAMLDLSGLEEAQQSLEEERQHCATVLERVPAVVAEIKPDGRTVAVHGDCWKLLGYEREQLIGRDWWETLFPGHLQEPIRDVVGAMRSGADLDDRALVMRTADGEERTLSWTTSNARNDRRELVSILAVAVDITERAETEEALQLSYREALERIKKLRCLGNVLRLTQDESLSLVEVISGIATSLPEAWGYPGITTSRISVYKRERRGGESPYPVVAFQSAPIMVSGEKVGEVQVCYHEDRPERFDGPFTADERELLDVIARRISEMIERRSAEESLAKLRLFRHNLIEQANLWVMALDRDRNVVLWNRVAEEISGYSRGEVVGHDRVWELLYPDRGYRTEIIHGMTEVTFGAHIAEDWETIIRARDGTDRVISWHANRLMDDDGTTLGSVVFGRETSQRRAAASS